MLARGRSRLGAVLLFGAALGGSSAACNERFEFDTEAGGSSSPPAAGSGGSAGGELTMAGGSAGQHCGALPACPVELRCVEAACVQCAADTDCVNPATARCDTMRHRCVQCLESADCDLGSTCDALASRCLPSCEEKADCLRDAHGCDARRGVCYQCDEDRECAASSLGHFCAIDGSGCAQCREDSDCPSQHCDPLGGRCVECRDGADCASGLCSPTTFTCLAP